MAMVKISIQSLQDVGNGKPLFEGVNKVEDVTEVGVLSVGIIEHGTVNGQDVVMFMMEHEGKKILSQLSANLFNSVVDAFKGAQLRFKDEAAKRN